MKRVWSCMSAAARLLSERAISTMVFTSGPVPVWTGPSEATVTLRLTAVPTISSVAVTSRPALTSPGGSTPDTYGEGDTIRFTVTFSEAVRVTGDPQFGFSLSGRRTADYDSGSAPPPGWCSPTTCSPATPTPTASGSETMPPPIRRCSSTPTTRSQALGATTPFWNMTVLGEQAGHKVDGSRISGNVAPQFPTANATRSVPENSRAGTAVGAEVTATDANAGDTLTYSLEGTDEPSFTIDSSTGQIETKSGVSYDHEAKSSYAVTVRAVDGEGLSDTIEVTIDVTDVDEQPARPARPRVRATSGETTSLEVSWSAPGLNGGPEITGYEVQYTDVASTNWMDWTHSDTATNTTITGLQVGAKYQVQVRALNGEMASDWSASGSATDAEDEPGVGPPTPPRDLRATGADRSVSLGWRAPVDDGGARIVRYEYRQQAGDGPPGDWQIIWDRRGEESHLTTRRHRVTGLANGTSYTFELRAVNNGGWASRPSGSASATPADEESTPVPAVPAAGLLLLAALLAAGHIGIGRFRPLH